MSGTDRTWEQRFGYDRYGNRTGLEKFSGASTTPLPLDNKTHPTINPTTNRFNTGQGYTYDKNGNLIDDPEGRTFIFNGDNKQRYVVKNGQNVGEYFYDGEGNRVKKKVYDTNGVTRPKTRSFSVSAISIFRPVRLISVKIKSSCESVRKANISERKSKPARK